MSKDRAAWPLFFLKQTGHALEDKKGMYWPIQDFHIGEKVRGKGCWFVSLLIVPGALP